MYIVKNNNGDIIYEGDNALQAKYVCAGFPEYDLYDENGNVLNKEEIFASLKRNRASKRKKETNIEATTTKVVEVQSSKVEVSKTEEKPISNLTTSPNVIIVDRDAIIRTEASDKAPAIKNSMVDPNEKKYLKHKGDAVIAVIKKGTAMPYIEKVKSFYKIKSGYIKTK